MNYPKCYWKELMAVLLFFIGFMVWVLAVVKSAEIDKQREAEMSKCVSCGTSRGLVHYGDICLCDDCYKERVENNGPYAVGG